MKIILLFLLIICSQLLGFASSFSHTYAGMKHRISCPHAEEMASLCSDPDLSDGEENLSHDHEGHYTLVPYFLSLLHPGMAPEKLSPPCSLLPHDASHPLLLRQGRLII